MSYQVMDRPNESTVLSLADTVTLKIAIPLWMDHLSLFDPNTVDPDLVDEDPENILSFFEPIDVRQLIVLPTELESRLKNCLAELKRETDLWIFHHTGKFFPKKHITYIIPCLKNLVFRFDGSIDYDGTARKLVRDEYLEEFDRARIAETFFLLDYLREYFSDSSDDQLRRKIYPEGVLGMMIHYGESASWDQMGKFHGRLERFLKWYFSDEEQKEEFKSLAMQRNGNTCDEGQNERVRIILYGIDDI